MLRDGERKENKLRVVKWMLCPRERFSMDRTRPCFSVLRHGTTTMVSTSYQDDKDGAFPED